MTEARNIFNGDLQSAIFSGREGSYKFFRHTELPGKLIREGESLPIRAVKNEVRAMQGLLYNLEGQYGIQTVSPVYLIGPGDGNGDARAYAVCDEIPFTITAEEALDEGGSIQALDDLNSAFLRHTRDLVDEGGVYNTELMHLHQYVMFDNRPVLVDVEPQFTRILAPPEARLDRDRDMIAVIDILEGIVQNAIYISHTAGERSISSHSAEKLLNDLELSEASILHARDVLLDALQNNSDIHLKAFFNDETNIEWQNFQHAEATRMYVALL